MTVLNNVTFAYIKIQNPVNKYQSTDSEYTVDCIVSKADAKAWNKEFPKQKAKEVDNAEFTDKFKMDPPFPEQDEQFVIKLKKPHIRNGKAMDERYRPRVFLAQSEGEPKDITFEVLPANGSKGKAAYNVRSNDFGNFAQMDSILIEDLVEYKSSASVGGAFGVSSVAPAPEARVVNKQTDVTTEPQSSLTNTNVAAEKKAPQEPVDDIDSDDPF